MSTEVDVAFRCKVCHADLGFQFKAGGGSQREAYETLQAIWLKLGFDTDEGEADNTLRNNLEYVMEVVWGFCSPGASIWDGSLSRNV